MIMTKINIFKERNDDKEKCNFYDNIIKREKKIYKIYMACQF